MGVSIFMLNLVFMLVDYTSGMVRMNVSSPAPVTGTLTVSGGTFLAFSSLLVLLINLRS